MMYVVMRRDKQLNITDAVAVFDSRRPAVKHAALLGKNNETYDYHINSVIRNPGGAYNALQFMLAIAGAIVVVSMFLQALFGV